MTDNDTSDASPDMLRVERTLEYEKLIREGEWPSPHDKLERHKEIESRTPMLTNSSGPFVFGLDSDWGGGKTFTVQLWRLYLKKELGISSIYLNAWEGDYSLDPLVSLLAQIDTWLSQQKGKKGSWEKAKQLAPALIKGVAGLIYKNASVAGLKASNIADPIIESIDKANNQDFIVAYQETQQSMREFRNCLNDALTCLPEHQKNLIIFVDELDRCNPTYAIMMLERIKHLFNIDKIVFVLSINSDQLVKAFRGVYGSGFDGSNYLKRFLDLTYHLKEPDIEQYINHVFSQESMVASFRKPGSNDGDAMEEIIKSTQLIAPHIGYKLRDINQLASNLKIIARSLPSNNKGDSDIYALLTCLLILYRDKPGLYKKYKQGYSDQIVKDVISHLTDQTSDSSIFPDNSLGRIVGLLIYMGFSADKEQSMESTLHSWIGHNSAKLSGNNSPNPSGLEILRYTVNTLSTTVEEKSSYRSLIFDHIELLKQIDDK